MGTAPFGGQKWPLQMGAQQAAAAGPVLSARLGQHGQGLAQRRDGTGDQRRADRLDTIAPEPLQQPLQAGVGPLIAQA